jgi:hypothetical protein
MGNTHRVNHAPMVRLLAGIGAIILVILAILAFMGFSLQGVIRGLLLLLVGLVVLISCFGSYKHGIPFTAVFILVMGIVAIIIGYLAGGIFGLIAGIIIFIAGIIGLL